LLGNVDFANLFFVLKDAATGPAVYATVAEAQAAGAVTLNYGLFINTVISFLIVAFAIFIVIKNMNRLKREAPAPVAETTTKECPHCFSTISIKATKCPNCTSALGK
jgi:large conductance mechanosensitive channel